MSQAEKVGPAHYDLNFVNLSAHSFQDFINSRFQKYRMGKVMQLFTPEKSDRVVELGCGVGRLCFTMAAHSRDVTGVDFSSSGIDTCNRLLQRCEQKNISFLCRDAQDTGLESEAYDAVVCADVFEHLYPEQAEEALDECERLLKKGGKVSIWTPHRGHVIEFLKNRNLLIEKDEGHVDYKSMRYLVEGLRRRGFAIRKAYHAESHIPVFRLFEKLFMWAFPFLRRRIAILAEKTESRLSPDSLSVEVLEAAERLIEAVERNQRQGPVMSPQKALYKVAHE